MAFHFVWTVLCNFACMCNCSLSRLHSGACAVPYTQVIQRHGIGSSESLWERLQSPQLPPCDLNQERDFGRLLPTLRLSPEKLACFHGNHWLPFGGRQFGNGLGISGAHKESEHSGQHCRYHRPDGKLLLRVCLMLSWFPLYFSQCKCPFPYVQCFCRFKLGPQQVEEVLSETPQRLLDRVSALIELAADTWIVTGRQPLPLIMGSVYVAWQSLNPTVSDVMFWWACVTERETFVFKKYDVRQWNRQHKSNVLFLKEIIYLYLYIY